MRQLCVLCFFISALLNVRTIVAEDHGRYRKCCAQNESLLKNMDSFECVNRDSASLMYNITNFSQITSDNVPREYGIPENCTLQIVPVTEVEITPMSNDMCYDRMIQEIIDGSLMQNIPKTVALRCVHNDTETLESKINVELFRKCCPPGEAYDAKYHVCKSMEEENTTEWLLTQFNLNSSSYDYGVETGLNCKNEEFSVDLSSETFALELEGSVLKVDGKSKVARGDWCVDRDHYGYNVIARVCTQNCSEYGAFCFRKCCPIGYHYKPKSCSGSRSVCVPSVDVIFNMSIYFEPLTRKASARGGNLLGKLYVCRLINNYN